MRGFLKPIRMRGPFEQGGRWTPLQKFDFFVDSVNGSDANHGQSPAEAFQTISALTPFLANNVRIGLARGSEWREQLDTSAYTGVVIGAYGSGRKPTLRADDIVESWVKTDGRTNVYETTWTPLRSIDQAPYVYEDDEILFRVESLDLCDSTPGSFYASNVYTINTPAPIYIHPTGSGDPNSNGKVYEQAVRNHALLVGNDSIVRGIRTKRQLHDHGSFEIGKNALVEDCIFEDGGKHNALMAQGTYRRCVAWKADPRVNLFIGTGSTMFVHYSGEAGIGDQLYEDCQAIMQPIQGHRIAAFYGHGQSGNPYGTVTYRRCVSAYTEIGFDSDDADNLVVEDCYAYRVGIGFQTPALVPSIVRRCEYFNDLSASFTYTAGWGKPTVNITAQHIIEDSVIMSSVHGVRFYGTTGDSIIRRCAIIGYDSTINTYGIYCTATSGADALLTMRDTIMQNWGMVATKYFVNIDGADGSVFTALNNIYVRLTGTSGRFKLNGVTQDTPPLWLAAQQPGNEVGSTFQTTTQFDGDPLTRNYGILAGSAAANQGAGPVGFVKSTFDYTARVAELASA